MRIALALLVGWISIAPSLGEPGESLRTNGVIFAWEFNPPEDNVLAYYLYYRTNLPDGITWEMIRTNWPKLDIDNPFPAKADGWVWAATVPGNSNTVDVDRLPGCPTTFFVLSASNVLGESELSNIVMIPPAPTRLLSLRLLEGR